MSARNPFATIEYPEYELWGTFDDWSRADSDAYIHRDAARAWHEFSNWCGVEPNNGFGELAILVAIGHRYPSMMKLLIDSWCADNLPDLDDDVHVLDETNTDRAGSAE